MQFSRVSGFMALVLLIASVASAQPATATDVTATVRELYDTWQKKMETDPRRAWNDDRWALEMPEFLAIVKLGLTALPAIVQVAASEPVGLSLYNAISRLTGVDYDVVFPTDKLPWSEQNYTAKAKAALLAWWQAGPEPGRQQFEALARLWPEGDPRAERVLRIDRQVLDPRTGLTKTVYEDTDLGKTYHSLCGLGIQVLPPLMAQFRAGDTHLLWLAAAATHNAAPSPDLADPAGSAQRILRWWDANQERWTIPWPPRRP